jgi:hypothetical protein
MLSYLLNTKCQLIYKVFALMGFVSFHKHRISHLLEWVGGGGGGSSSTFSSSNYLWAHELDTVSLVLLHSISHEYLCL